MVNEARDIVRDAEIAGRDVKRMREYRFLAEEGGRFKHTVLFPEFPFLSEGRKGTGMGEIVDV